MTRTMFAAFALLFAPLANAKGTLVQVGEFTSKHVLARKISIWLPPDYASGTRRYPVLYMHDGQNLFDPATAYGGQEWGIDEALVAMRRDVIVVGVWNTRLRGREYFPEKVFVHLSGPAQDNVLRTHGGVPLGDAYLKFLVEELKPHIDRTYRTRRGPRDTAIMGSSMGGLISLYAMAEYPRVFGSAAAVSIHWPMANPETADVESTTAAWATYLKTTRLRPGANRLYMDHGTETLDRYYAPYAARIDVIMPKLGWRRDVNWVSRVFPGTAHNEVAWRARVDVPIGFLFPSRR